LGCGFCEGQADCDGVGPHGIRCLVKVAFVSVHVGQTGRIVDGGIGGAVGSENGFDLVDEVWSMATNVLVGSGGVVPFFLIVRGTSLRWLQSTSGCTVSLGCKVGLLGLCCARTRASR